MSFSLVKDIPGKQFIDSYVSTYNSINNLQSPVNVNSNFSVLNYDSNCFLCSSASGKLYILLPNPDLYQGRFLYFVNVTDNELVSVSDLTSLTEVNNILNYNILSSSILNSYSQYFSILFSDGSYWYRLN